MPGAGGGLEAGAETGAVAGGGPEAGIGGLRQACG